MKQKYFYKTLHLIAFLGILNLIGCTDKWDEHYDSDSTMLGDKTLTEYINGRSDLSSFAELLKVSGYDSILSLPQSHTIWVPTNDGLAEVDLNDKEEVLKVVENHIAKSQLSTNIDESKSVYMLNGKYVDFTKESNGYAFGKSGLLELNIPASNGLVHIVDNSVAYLDNIWEYIGNTEGLDSLRKYMFSKDTMVFDPINSELIGYNDNDEPVYDTVEVYGNPFLETLGSLNVEDSVYTAILPDNTAWIEAYDRITNYLNIPSSAGGEEQQHELTQRLIIYDMVFRGKVENYAALDSIITTTDNVYYEPHTLFEGIAPTDVSNGLVYNTSQMPFTDTASFFKEIRIEAEYSTYRSNANSDINVQTSYGSGLEVSNNRYLEVVSTSTSSTSPSSVTFQIPNTLSAKYNIYCVFVPHTISNETKQVASQVKFRLTYIRSDSGRTRRQTITPENNITHINDTTKMLVKAMEFEFADIMDEDQEKPIVKLEVISDVYNETDGLTPDMRIDCIILEPVID